MPDLKRLRRERVQVEVSYRAAWTFDGSAIGLFGFVGAIRGGSRTAR